MSNMEMKVKLLKKIYPVGTIVVCDYMDDPYNPVPSGTKGTVIAIDSIGQIHVDWENGSGLALTDRDIFHKIKGDE